MYTPTRDALMFYYRTNVPTETQKRERRLRTIQWWGQLKSVRCEELTDRGTRCKRYNVIGAGQCPGHLASHYDLCIKTCKDKNSSLLRFGVFTVTERNDDENTVLFREGDYVLTYLGEQITLEEKIERYGESNAPYCIGGPDRDESGDFDCPFIDAALYRSTASLINHAPNEEANCAFIYNDDSRTVEIRALRDICFDEELTCDYGEEYISTGESAGTFTTRRTSRPLPEWFV